MSDKSIARRAKKKKKRGEVNKGVGCLTPPDQRKHMVQNNKDRAFALEYLRTMSSSAAGRSVGLAEKTVVQASWTYLRKPAVQVIIKAEMDKRTDAAGVTEERIIRELEALAFSVVKDFVAFNDNCVSLVPSKTLTRVQAAAIQSVQSKPTKDGGTVVSIKMYDKLKALELLMRCKGMISSDGKGAFGAADSHTMAERVMADIEQMSKVTAAGEDGKDGRGDERPR